MKTTSKFARLFSFLWFDLYKDQISEDWDKLLNALIDRGNVTSCDGYRIIFENRYHVWIKNHPYASGNLCNSKEFGLSVEPYPIMETRIKLEDFYYNNIIKGETESALTKKLDKLNNGSDS